MAWRRPAWDSASSVRAARGPPDRPGGMAVVDDGARGGDGAPAPARDRAVAADRRQGRDPRPERGAAGRGAGARGRDGDRALLVLRGGLLLHARVELHGDDAPGRAHRRGGDRPAPRRRRVRDGGAPVGPWGA